MEDVSFFDNSKRFFNCRRSLAEYWRSQSSGILDDKNDINELEKNNAFDPSLRQQSSNGSVVKTIPDLYESATLARAFFSDILATLVDVVGLESESVVCPPLKGQSRAVEKALDDYSQRVPGPGISWLFDIVRASIECDNDLQIAAVIDYLMELTTHNESNTQIRVIRMKNRFARPTPGGFRDINMNILLQFPVDNRVNPSDSNSATTVTSISHVCELQIHLRPLKTLSKSLHSHDVYSYFRSYFRGSDSAVEARLQLMEDILGDQPTTDAGAEIVSTLHNIVENAIDTHNKAQLYSLKKLLDWMNGKDAEMRVQRVLLSWEEEELGPDDPTTLAQINNLGVLLAAAELHEEARSVYMQALSSYQRLYGDHCDFALETMNNLGVLAGQMADYPEAKRYYQSALVGFETLFGYEHERTLLVVNNLGIVHRALGEHEDAASCYQRCLEGRERLLGVNHRDTIMVVNNLSVLMVHTGDYTQGLTLAIRAVDGYEKVWGPDHSETLGAVSNLGN